MLYEKFVTQNDLVFAFISEAIQRDNRFQLNESGFENQTMLELLAAPSTINLEWALSLIAAPPEQ